MYSLYIMEGRDILFTIFGNKILITTKSGNYKLGNKLIERYQEFSRISLFLN